MCDDSPPAFGALALLQLRTLRFCRAACCVSAASKQSSPPTWAPAQYNTTAPPLSRGVQPGSASFFSQDLMNAYVLNQIAKNKTVTPDQVSALERARLCMRSSVPGSAAAAAQAALTGHLAAGKCSSNGKGRVRSAGLCAFLPSHRRGPPP